MCPIFQITSKAITAKDIASAQRDIEIATMRGMSQKEVYSHDFFQNSTLFNGNIPTKPDKAQLVTELEAYLQPEDKIFDPDSDLTTYGIIDFMSSVRSAQHKIKPQSFGDLVKNAHKPATEFKLEMTLFAYDSYVENSLKEGERLRRAADGTIDIIEIKKDTPLPKQMPQFWALPSNKVKLEQLSREMAMDQCDNVLISGMVINDELVTPQIKQPGSPPCDLPELSSWIEEADSRIPPLVKWSAENGCKRMLVFSNDADSVCLGLRYWSDFENAGLCELWVHYGKPRRWIPIHKMKQRIGDAPAKAVIKGHILTGNDHLSKVGTKHAALHYISAVNLSTFGETSVLSEHDINVAEEYLVKCYNGVKSICSVKTFDELRLLTKSTKIIGLDQLPPTSAVIRKHIRRAYFDIRHDLTLLEEPPQLDPLDFGWRECDSVFLPDKNLNPIPDEKLKLCGCAGKCENAKCNCKKSSQICVIYCHKKVPNSPCLNR